MRTLHLAICAGLLATGGMQLAHAAEPGFYVGVSVGQSDYDVGASGGILVSIGGPLGGGVFMVQPASTQVEDNGVSWSAILGYRIHKYVAAELAYMNFADANVTETFEVPGFSRLSPPSFTITQRTRMTVQGPAASLLGLLPLGAGWEVYLRAGVLFADQERKVLHTSADKVTFGSEEWLAGAGVQWTFAKRWGLRLEYQRFDTIDSNGRGNEMDLDLISLTGTFAL